ncbi:glycosyltransferase family 4 protein [Pseudomonas sp. ZB1P45]|uniref:glycosyltransferase family 4 protein n=1 Tax=Pseudomonas frigoris TaxID=3398356 RepID=UPI0039EEC5DB
MILSRIKMLVGPFLPGVASSQRTVDYTLLDLSGLFDREWYLATNTDIAASGTDPLAHYLEHGWKEGRNPSAFFDGAWYLVHNPDVAQADINPLLHYVRSGQSEGRAPNAFFDSDWYERFIVRTEEDAGCTAFVFFWSRDAAMHPPLPELQPLYACRTNVLKDARDQYMRLVAAAQPWWARFGRDKFAIIVALFSPYEDHPGIGTESADTIERLIAFLTAAWEMEIAPGPLFGVEHYRRIIQNRGLVLQDGETLLQHFLREGIDKRIVPTRYFDENYYYAQYPSVVAAYTWAFEHFISRGVFEGGRASSLPQLIVAQPPSSMRDGEARLNNWKYFLSSCGNGGDLGELYRSVPHYSQVIEDILHSTAFAKTISRALMIEPAIGDVSDISNVLVAPFHDGRNLARRALRELFERDHYDMIVCVPWIRTGGADLVACQICEAVSLAFPNKSVLLLRTDQPNFDRPEWVSAGVDVVDASSVFRDLPPLQAQTLLYSLFMGLAPSWIININSRLCWDVMARFGTRLSESIDLYSYLFCWDQTASGYRAGYPSEFFPETASHLRAVFTDTIYMKNELAKIYNLPASLSERIVPLFSPSRGDIGGQTATEEGIKTESNRLRRRVLWAGRLDRQKRFDLVQEIAHKMPEVDFLCWGTPLLNAPPDYSRSPANLILHEGFSSYDELPLYDADLWLFTSDWEGMPTILIELALRGVSIVASAVGGVPELIDEQTGWPVDGVRSVDDYVGAIHAALGAPHERIVRAQRLRERARSRHSMQAYAKQVSDVLNEKVSA